MPAKASGAKPSGRERTPKRARARRASPKVDWRPAFLAAYAETGAILYACEAAGVGKSTVYDERKRSTAFRDAMAEASELAGEALEREARRRALTGVREPIIGRVARDLDGQLHDADGNPMHLTRYSDQLLMFLLRGLKPERYRERFEVRHITTDMIDAEIERLAAEITALGGEVPAE